MFSEADEIRLRGDRIRCVHTHRIFRSGDVADSEIRCKGRDKKSTPEEECKISTNSTYSLRKRYEFSTCSADFLRLYIIHPCSTKIIRSEAEFRLIIIKDDSPLGVGSVLV